MLQSECFSLFLCLLLVVRWIRTPKDRKRTEVMFLVAMFGPFAVPLNTFAISIVELLNAQRTARYDLYVYVFDRLLGDPSFRIGQFLLAHHWLFLILQVHYEGLAVAVTAVYLLYYYKYPAEKGVVACAFAFSLFGALPIYLFCPVSGPYYAFAGFPHSPGPIVPHIINLAAAPNGVPSNHMSLALLCAAFLWRFRYGGIIGTLIVAMTIVETLGFGEHYVFDLLVALPFSWICWRLAFAVGHLRLSSLAQRAGNDRGPTSVIVK